MNARQADLCILSRKKTGRFSRIKTKFPQIKRELLNRVKCCWIFFRNIFGCVLGIQFQIDDAIGLGSTDTSKVFVLSFVRSAKTDGVLKIIDHYSLH